MDDLPASGWDLGRVVGHLPSGDLQAGSCAEARTQVVNTLPGETPISPSGGFVVEELLGDDSLKLHLIAIP